MICFHFCIFVVLATTAATVVEASICCDLLSFLYLCRTGNNFTLWQKEHLQLWFAFIFVSLSYWQQRFALVLQIGLRCDLLSFLYLCRTGNNRNAATPPARSVVICFHFCIFVVLATTAKHYLNTRLLLWFAFIFVSLSYWQQRKYTSVRGYSVVICFHFCIFVVLATTSRRQTPATRMLWFAFIFVSLSYWQQPINYNITPQSSCDLLSFLYLCRTGNNNAPLKKEGDDVVICFHFCIFVVLATTIV